MLALDIHPHIHLGEVREREDAEMLAGLVSPVEEIPEFGALVFGIPLAELITVRKEALLGAGLFLITAAATEAGVEFVLLDGVEKGNGLKLVAGGIGALLLFHAALVDRVLDEADHEPGSEFFGKGIAVVERLLEIMSGVHMQEQERNFRRPERLRREVGHDDGILAAREKQGGVLELGRRLTQDVNGFGFEVVEMVELVVRHLENQGSGENNPTGLLGGGGSPRHDGTEMFQQKRGTFLSGSRLGVKNQASVVGLLEPAVLAGELLDRTVPRLGVKPLGVTLRASLERRADIDLMKIRPDKARSQRPQFPARRDNRDENDHTEASEEFRCLGDAADILGAVFVRETKVGVQPRAEVVAIENRSEPPLSVQRALHGIRDSGFSRARKAIEPKHDTALAEQGLLLRAPQKTPRLRVNVSIFVILHGPDSLHQETNLKLNS